MKTTLYDLIGARPDAAREDIEQAYREAVGRLQPEIDAGKPDALNQLRLLREAFQILADPERRARYDAWIEPLAGVNEGRPARKDRIDGFGWAIVVTLAAVAIGATLTVIVLLERAEDVRIEYAEMLRQKKARTHNQPQVMIVRQPAASPASKTEIRP